MPEKYAMLISELAEDARSLLKSELTRTTLAANTKQQEGGEKVDMKTLVVGQDVYMVSGCYGSKGKVVKVTSDGVEVQVSTAPSAVARWSWLTREGTREWRSKSPDEIWRFDTNGNACDSRDTGMFVPGPWEHCGVPSTYECGPWELDDVPVAEREALLEQAAQRFQKWESMDCEHSKIGEHYYIEKCPICGCDNPNCNPTAAKDRLHHSQFLRRSNLMNNPHYTNNP